MIAILGSVFRVLRMALLVLVLIGIATWWRGQANSVRSEQGVINAEIVQIRTPIAGELSINGIQPGATCRQGELLFKLTNARFGDRESAAQYNELQNVVESLKSDLLGAQDALANSETARTRAERLYQREILARVEMEDAETHYKMARQQVAAKQEQLSRCEARAAGMAQQLEMQKVSEVRMPVDGLIWSVAGKSGEQFDANKPVLDIINPSHIWVDAFFSESDAQDLKPGLSGEVRSLDGAGSWPCRLVSVRAGVGRMSYDSTVAVPPPELAKRQIAVRVEAEWKRPFSAVEFYGVGRSVEVTFHHGKPERTVADALREKMEWLWSRPGTAVALP